MQCASCGKKIGAGYAQNIEKTIIYCLDCHHLANQDRFKAMQYSLAMMNDLAGQIDDVFGLPRQQRYTIPQDNYIISPTTNHFSISNSVVGSINTGIVHSLNNSLEKVAVNDIQLAEQLKSLSEKITASADLKDSQKEQALEAVTFLAEQSQKQSNSKNKVMIKSAAKILRSTISLAADLATLAPLVAPIIGKI